MFELYKGFHLESCLHVTTMLKNETVLIKVKVPSVSIVTIGSKLGVIHLKHLSLNKVSQKDYCSYLIQLVSELLGVRATSIGTFESVRDTKLFTVS